MKRKFPEEKESCWSCKHRIYKFRKGGPFNFCKKPGMFFGQHERIDKQMCSYWEY